MRLKTHSTNVNLKMCLKSINDFLLKRDSQMCSQQILDNGDYLLVILK